MYHKHTRKRRKCTCTCTPEKQDTHVQGTCTHVQWACTRTMYMYTCTCTHVHETLTPCKTQHNTNSKTALFTELLQMGIINPQHMCTCGCELQIYHYNVTITITRHTLHSICATSANTHSFLQRECFSLTDYSSQRFDSVFLSSFLCEQYEGSCTIIECAGIGRGDGASVGVRLECWLQSRKLCEIGSKMESVSTQ